MAVLQERESISSKGPMSGRMTYVKTGRLDIVRRMMRQGQFENGKSTFSYKIEDGKTCISGYEGDAARIEVPEQAGDFPAVSIGRKAFLSRKELYAVTLPDTIEDIGDWAFAYCDNLREISLPGKDIRFGRAVFKNCGKLERIVVRHHSGTHRVGAGVTCGGESGEREEDAQEAVRIYGAEERNGEMPYHVPELLAAAVTMLDAYYLLDLPAAGSREWLEKWDSRLRSLLRTADQEGYISQSVYGEEDYIGTDLEEYISARRKEKVRLAFVRLLHPQALPPELKEELEDYLRRLTKGREGEEAWRVLLQEHGGDREHYSLFAALSCVTEENLDGILADIGEEYPEMKAFFLTLDKSGGDGDFFTGLEL